jgi:membrane protease YdiL (CAAX protease family)
MTAQENRASLWATLPVSLRAIIAGIVIALIPANVWPLLLLSVAVPVAASVEVVFLGLYIWWASGGGPPHRTRAARGRAFRSARLSGAQCFWVVIGALFFAATIHAAIVLLFRFVPFPAAAFRRGYDLSFIPSLPMRWIAVVVSATSAAVCEETGFRGYLQQPIEQCHGATIAILVSSFFFMLLHLTKGLGDDRDGADSVWGGRAAWASRVVVGISYSKHDRPRRNGHWAVCLLVDRHRGQLHRAADYGDGCRPAFPNRMRRLSGHTYYCAARGLAAKANQSLQPNRRRSQMTVIEIKPHRWGWKVFEAPGVEPVFPQKDHAIDYAPSRACATPREKSRRLSAPCGAIH